MQCNCERLVMQIICTHKHIIQVTVWLGDSVVKTSDLWFLVITMTSTSDHSSARSTAGKQLSHLLTYVCLSPNGMVPPMERWSFVAGKVTQAWWKLTIPAGWPLRDQDHLKILYARNRVWNCLPLPSSDISNYVTCIRNTQPVNYYMQTSCCASRVWWAQS